MSDVAWHPDNVRVDFLPYLLCIVRLTPPLS